MTSSESEVVRVGVEPSAGELQPPEHAPRARAHAKLDLAARRELVAQRWSALRSVRRDDRAWWREGFVQVRLARARDQSEPSEDHRAGSAPMKDGRRTAE